MRNGVGEATGGTWPTYCRRRRRSRRRGGRLGRRRERGKEKVKEKKKGGRMKTWRQNEGQRGLLEELVCLCFK